MWYDYLDIGAGGCADKHDICYIATIPDIAYPTDEEPCIYNRSTNEYMEGVYLAEFLLVSNYREIFDVEFRFDI